MEPFGFDPPIQSMAKGYLSFFLVLALAFSSVGFTVTETICPKNLTKAEMARCAKCMTPGEKKCCKEIVKRAALVTEFERVVPASAKAALPVQALALDQSLEALAFAFRSPISSVEQRKEGPPSGGTLEACVRTTVILI